MSSPRDRPVKRWRRGATAASLLALALGATLLTAAPAASSHGGAWHTVERASISSAGAQGNGTSGASTLSADGRFVAFGSTASNLVEGDTNGVGDIFLRDRQAGTTERVSLSSTGAQGNDQSLHPSLSADGRTIAFHSSASNLVEGDTNGTWDVFVYDRQTGTTERASLSTTGAQGNGMSVDPSLSADGRLVAFASEASNLVEGDTNGTWDVFVRDRQTGTTERVSLSSTGTEGNDNSFYPSFSADGRTVAFYSYASILVEGDTNGTWDIFVRDRQTGTTERVSISSTGAQGNGNSFDPFLSADGRTVAFASEASNLVESDTNGDVDVFVRDRQTGTTARVSLSTTGAQGNDWSFYSPLSADGHTVVFSSGASNLVEGDTNGALDIFVRDRQTGITERVSLSVTGAQGYRESYTPSISTDGRTVAFHSANPNLVEGDTNGAYDVFVATLNRPPSLTGVPSRTLLYTHRTWTLPLATFTDPDPGDTHIATIDWGDGIVTSGVVDEQAGTVTGAHRYTAPDTYTVAVSVRDTAGDEGTASFQVVVRPHPRLRQ